MVRSEHDVALPSSTHFSISPPAVVTCGDPGTPSNGQRELSDQNFGTEVVYTCDEGYELEGSQRRICQASGEWSGQLPQCRSKCRTTHTHTTHTHTHHTHHTHTCTHTPHTHHTHTHTHTHAHTHYSHKCKQTVYTIPYALSCSCGL